MMLFSSENVDLKCPVIRDAHVDPTALRVLRDFHLFSLSAINLPDVHLYSLAGCLNEWTVHNLVHLNISGILVLDETNVQIVFPLCRFKNLQVLNVSKTKFTTSCLQILVKELPHLWNLNLSKTRITDISPLLVLKDKLTELTMHRLNLSKKEEIENLLQNIVQLKRLRYLDASEKHRTTAHRLGSVDRLVSGLALPDLMHIDLSGNQFGLRLVDARNLIENHPRLKFAGFASWVSSQELELDGLRSLSLQHPHITMLGDRGDLPILAILTRYKDRASYLQNALHSIFEDTNSREVLKPELLSAVIRVMRLHMRRAELILAGTAVVYNLTRGEQSSMLPLDLLNAAVRITLTAMKKFFNNQQLQKNGFLTLCSDNVLHRANFDCKHCCELVFDSLVRFDDVHMKRMGVAIISILAAEIPTHDLCDLSVGAERLRRLLCFVAEKCLSQADVADMLQAPYSACVAYLDNRDMSHWNRPTFDATLRFTLSALWNLTDECPEACETFIREGGLLIYAKVVKNVMDQSEEFQYHVYTKCLGLLNNVAEVPKIRMALLMNPLMEFFCKMLTHPNTQISYFAAGIISHLSCLSDYVWSTSLGFNKKTCIRALGQSVCSWHPPQSEMVAYRSLRPFESLTMDPNSCLEVHLWAVWAIHHILTKKEARYIPILRNCPNLQMFLQYLLSTDEISLCSSQGAPGPFIKMLKAGKIPYSKVLFAAGTFDKAAYDSSDGNAASSSSTEISSYITYEDSLSPTTYPHVSAHQSDNHSTLGGSGESFSTSTSAGNTANIASATGSGCRQACGDEEVGDVALGVTASAGPDVAQLTCARLIRQLAREIVVAVEHFDSLSATSVPDSNQPQPTASSAQPHPSQYSSEDLEDDDA